MKRFFVVSLILIHIFTCINTVAFAANYSSMTDEEIKEEIDAMRNELVVRGLKAEKKTEFFNDHNILIYIDGSISVNKKSSWSNDIELDIPVVIVNNSDKNIGLVVRDASVNGWAVEGYFENSGEVPAGKKMKCLFYFYVQNTDVENINEFNDAEFKVRVYNKDTWKDLFVSKSITIYADQ